MMETRRKKQLNSRRLRSDGKKAENLSLISLGTIQEKKRRKVEDSEPNSQDLNKIDPIMFEPIKKKQRYIFNLPNGSSIAYNVSNLVDSILATGNFHDPVSRVMIPDQELEKIDQMIESLKLKRPSLMELKKNPRIFEEQKERENGILAIERCAGDSISKILALLENPLSSIPYPPLPEPIASVSVSTPVPIPSITLPVIGEMVEIVSEDMKGNGNEIREEYTELKDHLNPQDEEEEEKEEEDDNEQIDDVTRIECEERTRDACEEELKIERDSETPRFDTEIDIPANRIPAPSEGTDSNDSTSSPILIPLPIPPPVSVPVPVPVPMPPVPILAPAPAPIPPPRVLSEEEHETLIVLIEMELFELSSLFASLSALCPPPSFIPSQMRSQWLTFLRGPPNRPTIDRLRMLRYVLQVVSHL